MNKGDLIEIALKKDVDRNHQSVIERQDGHEKLIYEEENGRHGLRITEDKKLAFYDGYDWIKVETDPKKIRDTDEVPLRVQVSNQPPTAEDGRIYLNSKDKLFYICRDGQWFRLFVAGEVIADSVEWNKVLNKPNLVAQKIIASATEPSLNTGDQWHKEY